VDKIKLERANHLKRWDAKLLALIHENGKAAGLSSGGSYPHGCISLGNFNKDAIIGGAVVQFPVSALIKIYNCFCFILDYLSCLTNRFKAFRLRISECGFRNYKELITTSFGKLSFEPSAGAMRQAGHARRKINPFLKIQASAQKAQHAAISTKHLFFLSIALLFALCALPLHAAHASQVTLGWNPPADSVAGYKIHYGTTSGNYDYSVDVGAYDSCVISGLAEGQTYYFAATSYNADNIESVYSKELVHTMPSSEPDMPAAEPDIPSSEPDTPSAEPDIPASEAPATPADGGGGTEVTTFSPAADATVIISSPARNYGSRSYLEVDASSEKISYLRFNVSGLSGTVVSARIQLKCINKSSFGGTIYGISDTSWQELTVTWDNQPGIDGLARDVLGVVSVGDIVELDVTAVVTGNGTYNFAMDSDNNDGADYYSREGLNPPGLIITTVAAEDPAANEPTAPTDTDIEAAHILIEAEDAQINYPFEYGQDGEASSDGFIWVPNRAGSVWNPAKPGGYAEFIFEVPQAGNYVIWGRILANNGSNNSFFVSMDDGNFSLWSTAKSKKWIWDQVSSRGGADPVVYYLQAGEHTLTIKQREDGTKLDKILITNDFGYVPEGPGE
jgi:hypothetical protein